MNSLKQYIDNRLVDVTVSQELVNRILSNQYEKSYYKRHSSFRKCISISLAVILSLVLSTTALAATVPSVNDWLYAINTDIAELLYPVGLSAEDNGIKLNVSYAANDNHTAIVYFSLHDTVGDRIDNTTDIYNYDLVGPNGFSCRMVSYDETTNTSYFQLIGTGDSEINGKMTILQVESFISDKTEYDWFNTQIEFTQAIDENASNIPISNFTFLGGSYNDNTVVEEQINVLIPDATDISLRDDIDFVTISNIGFVDQKLHIQTKWTESVDNHGDISLIDSEGSRIPCASYYYRVEEYTQGRDSYPKYIEYVFDINNIYTLKNCSLWATFVEDGTYTQGEWRVNFRLSDTEKIKISYHDDLADSIEITPIGVYINGYQSTEKSCDITVVLKDGTEVYFSRCIPKTNSDLISKTDISIIFDHPLDIEDIKTVSVDGLPLFDASAQ